MSWLEKIRTREAKVCLIGAGYVGLSAAVEVAKAGFTTTAIEVDRSRVAAIQAGRSYCDHIPDSELAAAVQSGRLSVSASYAPLAGADVILICVPTPITPNQTPDLSFVRAATEQIRAHLRAQQLVVLESTTYPGTTEEVVKPILERSGLVADRDFWLAFSPERIDPGNRRFALREVPKVVGGLGPESGQRAAAFYQELVDQVVVVSSAATAEMVKIYENVFRNINIAFANESALLCDRMGIDIWEVIDAAATKPYGFMPFYPGPGPGGHCIPVDPHYLSWRAKQFDFQARFIDLATDINMNMPYHVSSRIVAALNGQGKSIKGAQVLILGVSYKKDVADVRESPALKLIPLLQRQGAVVSYHDPYIERLRVGNPTPLSSIPFSEEALQGADCVVVLTDHSCYDYHLIARNSALIVDTRNALRGVSRSRVVRL